MTIQWKCRFINRFKGLDLIDRVPEKLWTEVHDIVQEAVVKTIPKKKKCKKVVWESLTNSYGKKKSYDKSRQCIKKWKHYFANKGQYS